MQSRRRLTTPTDTTGILTDSKGSNGGLPAAVVGRNDDIWTILRIGSWHAHTAAVDWC